MKPKCFFRGCDHKMKTSIAKKKLPLLIASQSIHCLTKASAFVPQCKTDGTTKPETGNHNLFVYLRSFGPSSLKRLFPPKPHFSALCASSIPCSFCK